MKVVVFSCSLSSSSKSRILANEAVRQLKELGHEGVLVDLREHKLPLCDGESEEPCSDELAKVIRGADAILMAAPIYNYDVNAAAKNLVEHAGGAWEGKLVGFLCAAGGHASHMSVMSLANSLMLDFRCIIVPRFVYAVGGDFSGEQITSPKIVERVKRLCEQTGKLAEAIRGAEVTM